MKNSSAIDNWFLMKYPDAPGLVLHGCPTDELYKYFTLPTDTPVCLFGNTYNDTRADAATTAFTDGHRILTGDLIAFTTEQAETERTYTRCGQFIQSMPSG